MLQISLVKILKSMAMVISSVHATLFARASFFCQSNGLRSFRSCLPFSSSAASVSTRNLSQKKWRQPVLSVLDVGGVKISREGTLGISFWFPFILNVYCLIMLI